MADLLNCPFCGSEARAENYVIEAAALCTGCPAKIICSHGPRDDNGLPEAIEAWNTRATQPPAVGVDVSDEIVRRLLKVLDVSKSNLGADRPDDEDDAAWWDELESLDAALRTGGGAPVTVDRDSAERAYATLMDEVDDDEHGS